MSNITNSSSVVLDVILISAEPKYLKVESTTPMLNGNWHTQTIGTRATKLQIKLVGVYSVLLEVLGYADTKETLTVDYLGTTYIGFIIGIPDYEILVPSVDPTYSIDFELAVVSSV